MEASTTVKKMLAGNHIFVPTYQRAYSWDTEIDKSKPFKQVNTFLSDLEDYQRSNTKSKYYFGHFLFEEKTESKFGVIDGQQRLTTIVIFLSSLFQRIKSLRDLTEEEIITKEDMIVRGSSTYRFITVDYDEQLFIDCIINQEKTNNYLLETESAKRIVKASEFFTSYFSDKDEIHLLELLNIIQQASCTTHPVKDEAEAIQMFIFQNNRGKKPSNLEVIKAQFMFNIHLYGNSDKDSLLGEIKKRFEKIYKSISLIESYIKEDDVLIYTLRVYFNSLWETNPIDRINKELSVKNPLQFIRLFSQSLTKSFEALTRFLSTDEKDNIEIHSLVTIGRIGIIMPFIIKAYNFGLPIEHINSLCKSFESIVLRHKLIGTRADITSRLSSVYQNFTLENINIQPIIERIEHLKNVDSSNWWWSYWNNEQLLNSIQGKVNHSTAKYILWKYEHHLKSQGKKGYHAQRFDSIQQPELEHIAPQMENPETGYDKYDEEFLTQHLDCLGNYILLSMNHNRSIGNKPFKEKRDSYTYLEQQLEVQKMTADNEIWTRQLIQERKQKIINFIMSEL